MHRDCSRDMVSRDSNGNGWPFRVHVCPLHVFYAQILGKAESIPYAASDSADRQDSHT